MLHSKIPSEKFKIERESSSCMWLASLSHRVIYRGVHYLPVFMFSWLWTVSEFLGFSFRQGIYYKPNYRSIN